MGRVGGEKGVSLERIDRSHSRCKNGCVSMATISFVRRALSISVYESDRSAEIGLLAQPLLDRDVHHGIRRAMQVRVSSFEGLLIGKEEKIK